jgi:hypothetical protein
MARPEWPASSSRRAIFYTATTEPLKAASQHLDAASDVAAAINISGEDRCRAQEKSGGNGKFDGFRFHN